MTSLVVLLCKRLVCYQRRWEGKGRSWAMVGAWALTLGFPSSVKTVERLLNAYQEYQVCFFATLGYGRLHLLIFFLIFVIVVNFLGIMLFVKLFSKDLSILPTVSDFRLQRLYLHYENYGNYRICIFINSIMICRVKKNCVSIKSCSQWLTFYIKKYVFFSVLFPHRLFYLSNLTTSIGLMV